jgi:hypothetical protein
MALIAVCAAKGAPGATVTSLALTLSWWRSALLAECDPSGGSVLAGYLGGQLPADRGLARLAVAERHGRLFDEFGLQLVDLGADRGGNARWLLPGVSDPANAAALGPMWPRLATYFNQLEVADPPLDVIADCGRLPAPHAPISLLHQADVVILVLERTMASIAAARPRIDYLQRELHTSGVGVLRLALRAGGVYTAKEIAGGLKVPVLLELPDDVRTARMLSNGDGVPKTTASLLRATRSGQDMLRQLIDTRRTAALIPSAVTHA